MDNQAFQHRSGLWMTAIGGLTFAVFLGLLVGQGQTKILLIILGFVLLATIILVLRTHVWLLIPLALPLGGTTGIIPGPFAVREMVVAMAAGMMLIMYVFKMVRHQPPPRNVADWFLILLVIDAVVVYIMNPAGLEIFQSERIGAKPYIDILLALTAYWILERVRLTPLLAVFIPFATFLVTAMIAALTMVVTVVPALAPLFQNIYSGISPQGNSQAPGEFSYDSSVERVSGFREFGRTGILMLVSYFNPTTYFSPIFVFRFSAFCIFSLAIFISGFRSEFVAAGFLLIASAYIRKGLVAVTAMAMAGTIGLCVLIVGQGSLFNLPGSIQRTLSFLPGKWSPEAVASAQGSIDWRVRMWERFLEGEGVDNYILGDGFGFERSELMAQLLMQNRDVLEEMMIVGGLHSGPLTTIRYFGIVGYILYLGFLVALCIAAIKLIYKTKGTPFFPAAMFVGLPIVWEPLYFNFIYGSFDSGFPRMIYAAGMMRLLVASFDDYCVARGASGPQSSEFTAMRIWKQLQEKLRGDRAPIERRELSKDVNLLPQASFNCSYTCKIGLSSS